MATTISRLVVFASSSLYRITPRTSRATYHGLPKTIRRSAGNAPGATVGFANFLPRFYADERPRAVIVGWDSLDAPTKRHKMFPAYQSGREFDEELIEQLVVVNLSPRLGLRTPKPQGSRRATFSPLPLLLRSVRAALPLWPAAIGIFSARLATHNDPLPVAGS